MGQHPRPKPTRPPRSSPLNQNHPDPDKGASSLRADRKLPLRSPSPAIKGSLTSAPPKRVPSSSAPSKQYASGTSSTSPDTSSCPSTSTCSSANLATVLCRRHCRRSGSLSPSSARSALSGSAATMTSTSTPNISASRSFATSAATPSSAVSSPGHTTGPGPASNTGYPVQSDRLKLKPSSLSHQHLACEIWVPTIPTRYAETPVNPPKTPTHTFQSK